eukprot:Blabericola_migrator_1__2214@NODE_1610_length_4173_cov_134_062835_g1049_i0_p2_GENE_NODE_1610_length_4173_cov_134_062835_g1049_i0NODE_1610_length_4173_cov_134_062835_g1049_i0_p2_ORF_typecomplete_len361_score95_56Med6/PF04934_14/5_8e22Med6/PF04934_14/6_2e03Tropomodulin/PF03250_14/0_26_NODE_1610_length_4173_cov_134_062835_g1049_i05641646
MTTEPHNDEALLFESFQDANFLRQTLNPSLALEYFYTSKFFDISSLNQRRRRGLPVAPDADGIEYTVVKVNAAGKGILPVAFNSPWNYPNNFGVYVIQKTRRTNRNEAPERIFYIAGGCIYQAPSLGALVLYRLQSCCQILDSVLEKLESMLHWSVLSGHHWKAPLNLDEIIEDAKRQTGTPTHVCDMSDGHSTDESSIADESSDESLSESDYDSDSIEDELTEEELESLKFRLDPLDTPTIPLSLKKMRPPKSTSISVVYQPRETEHAQEVIGKEFNGLFKASSRLSTMFVNEITERAETEAARRQVFAEYHQSIDMIHQALLNNMQNPLSRLVPGIDIDTTEWKLTEPKETDDKPQDV